MFRCSTFSRSQSTSTPVSQKDASDYPETLNPFDEDEDEDLVGLESKRGEGAETKLTKRNLKKTVEIAETLLFHSCFLWKKVIRNFELSNYPKTLTFK